MDFRLLFWQDNAIQGKSLRFKIRSDSIVKQFFIPKRDAIGKTMKRMIICLIIVFACVFAPESLLAVTIDDLGKSTVFLREQKQHLELKGKKEYEVWYRDPVNKQYEPKLDTIGGTGFLTSHNGKIYLVTARHVASNLTKKAEVLWNKALGEKKKFTFEFIHRKLPGSRWFYHPLADIAIHPFGFSEKADHILISEKMYWDSEKEISLGREVWILGYPLLLGIDKLLSPLLKKAEIASWLTSIDRPGLDKELVFILLDEDLASGYSGAPVFTSPGARFQGSAIVAGGAKLIGIQSMTMSDKTVGKISLVVPLTYLQEIYETKSFKDYEKKIGIK
jgi:hypothetical protein